MDIRQRKQCTTEGDTSAHTQRARAYVIYMTPAQNNQHLVIVPEIASAARPMQLEARGPDGWSSYEAMRHQSVTTIGWLTVDRAHDETGHKALPDGKCLWGCQRCPILVLGHLLAVECHDCANVAERLQSMALPWSYST
jgi:hypothetical protein